MAAKTLYEAITLSAPELSVIEKVKVMSELRDYCAHRVMLLSEDATALDLFNEIFASVAAEPKS